jgi:meso-butanediol dehydrogenase / (S,S)-butanediol dehydrogenase / diacetyl reductase
VTVGRVYVLCSDPKIRLNTDATMHVEYGTLGREPSSAHDLWIICAHFQPVDPLSCTEQQFEDAFAQRLRFCMQAVQRALSRAQHPNRIVLVALDDSETENSLAPCGVAALFSLARSLSIECTSLGISVNAIAMSSDQRFPCELLCGDILPQGHCLNLHGRAAPCGPTLRVGREVVPRDDARVAVVTGAARGLGRAIAQRCAARHDSVLLVDNDESSLHSTVREISEAGSCVAGFAGDVSSRKQMEAAAEQALSRWGSLNVWINNAGIAVRRRIEQTDLSEFDRVIDTNFKGTLWGSQVGIAAMAQRGGVVLNMSSTAARTAGLVHRGCYNDYAPYAASKAAIEALTRLLPQLLPSSVRVTGIAPGPIATELVERLYTAAQRRELERHIPAGRLGTVDDIASAADFLTSAHAGFISGAVLVVDGALSSWADA